MAFQFAALALRSAAARLVGSSGRLGLAGARMQRGAQDGRGFGVDVSLIGDKALQQKLNALSRNDQRKVLRRAMRAELKPIAAQAKQQAPYEYGDLESSIKVKATPRQKNVFGVAVYAGSQDIDYAGFQELGTENVEAQNFLRENFYAKREEIMERLGVQVGREIESLAADKGGGVK